ncbi:uridine kinase [Neocallimastix lanati (nom. inval.)]|uniref:Uridine kinase n=1 Tax=Neocallimastix californiae TaxID=1754190 RepID=A0A1Y2AG65_9FUNG|nr:uridine kinase [Neocallimastix sp. JGI-2020a]ORY21280.1 uridine kinase [Neocallimastix californiae]|eukprot:ORY21280.1 uridine kinase [Neocallimastix californiae]
MSGSKSLSKEIYSGRAPWYNFQGENIPIYIIGITGGSASGKTTVSERIIKELGKFKIIYILEIFKFVVLLSMDSFYKVLTPEQHALAEANNYNFDHPDSFDIDLLIDTLKKLKKGIAVDIPIYDFKTHSRIKETRHIYGANIIVFEGIFALYFEEVRKLMDLMLFIDTDSDIRLARRMRRDIAERGRDIDGVLKQYIKFVKPSFEDYIQPSKKYADVIIPRGAENTVALELIVTHIKKELQQHDIKFRNHIVNYEIDNEELLHSKLPKPITNEIIEICIICISNFGRKMEPIIKQKLIPDAVKDNYISHENILIQNEVNSNEPQLFVCELLSSIKQQHVFLVDGIISTGSVAIMAIKVLLDHNVKEENIIFLSLLSSPKGLYMVSKTFPKVKILTLNINQNIENCTNPFSAIDN